MASGLRRVGVPGSGLPGKSADRKWHRYTVGAASAIWRPERAVRLIRRTPEKLRNKPPPPICITYLVFQSRISIPADPLPDTAYYKDLKPPLSAKSTKKAKSESAKLRDQLDRLKAVPESEP